MNSATLIRAKVIASDVADELLLAHRDATANTGSTYHLRTAVAQLEKLAKVLGLELVPAADIQGVR